MKKAHKLLVSILVILLLFNFTTASISNAGDYSDFETDAGTQAEDSAVEELGGGMTIVLNIFTTPLKFLTVLPGMIISGIVNVLGGLAGDQVKDGIDISLYHIFFNKLAITDINILEFRWGDGLTEEFKNKDNGGDTSDQAFWTLRNNIATWYYAIRNLAIVILLIVLIYVGIRMALSTIAEEQAKYKTMLKDWFVALVLVFVLQYIVLLAINLNNVLVSALDPSPISASETANTTNANNDKMTRYSDYLFEKTFAFRTPISQSIGSAIIYSMLAFSTFAFLLMYIKRMITISFLTLIAPIITITYPIDKMGDRKSSSA